MAGLENEIVYKVKKEEKRIFSGTNSNLFFREVGANQWNKLTSDDISVRAFDILSPGEIIASFEFNDSDSITIAYTENGGESWQEYQNGFGGDTEIPPLVLESSPDNANIILGED